jgi:hypothetical protein
VAEVVVEAAMAAAAVVGVTAEAVAAEAERVAVVEVTAAAAAVEADRAAVEADKATRCPAWALSLKTVVKTFNNPISVLKRLSAF